MNGFPLGFSFVFHFGIQATGLDRFLFSYFRFRFFFFLFHFHVPVSYPSDTFLMCSRFCSVRFVLFETAGPLIFSRWSDSNSGVVPIVELYPKIASQIF